ncbi:MAG TPA: hypothetical protein PKM21_18170 [Anaerolineales bacterium]|nr:hypothetical protein [Anaerolineales bacterium]
MKIRLSHYGWMVVRQRANSGTLHLGNSPAGDLLLDLWTGQRASVDLDDAICNLLLADGLVERVADETDDAAISLRYRRNPFEYLIAWLTGHLTPAPSNEAPRCP